MTKSFLRRRLPLLMLLSTGLSACASLPSAGDRLFQSGELIGAATAYEQQLAQPGKTRIRGRAQILYRLSLIYARPGTPSFDPVRAGRLLERLMAEYPSSRYRPAAAVIRDLGRQLADIERASRSRDREIAALERESTRCRARLDQPTPTPPVSTIQPSEDKLLLSEERAACHAAMNRLRAAVNSRDEQITRLTSALEVLKRIDTEPETGNGSGG